MSTPDVTVVASRWVPLQQATLDATKWPLEISLMYVVTLHHDASRLDRITDCVYMDLNNQIIYLILILSEDNIMIMVFTWVAFRIFL